MKPSSILRRSCRPLRYAVATLPLFFFVFLFLLAAPSAKAQNLKVLHTFTGGDDGRYPLANLLRDEGGNFYSTTWFGGAFNYGTVFKIDGRGNKTVLHSFWGGDGLEPESGLIRDATGTLYGTTYEGGTTDGGGCEYGCGTVFKLDTTGKLTVLYAFTGKTDGRQPEYGLVEDEAGNLYGTTTAGGNLNACTPGYMGCGVVFKLDSSGNETVLHAFSGPDGWFPSGSLIRDSQGNLYGTTRGGGAFGGLRGWGTVFKLDPSGKETVLYSFAGGTDGGYPSGPLLQDADGNLYGTAGSGGESACSCGIVFKLDKNGKKTVLYSFHSSPDGAFPTAGVTRDAAGNLYGTTWRGGNTGCYDIGCGTIFKLDEAGNETVLYTFSEGSDGGEPQMTLIMDGSGNLYGTAPYGGDSSCGGGSSPGCGVVFELVP